MRLVALVLVTAVACSSQGLTQPGDGGTVDGSHNNGTSDGSAASPDLRGASCDQINQAVSDWFAQNSSCATDGDCQVVFTPCGLAGTCGAFVNMSATGTYLDGLEQQWNAQQCMGACPPCAYPAPPYCHAGLCTAWPNGPGVGSPCRQDGECPGGKCLLDPNATGFVGGYCTMDCSTGAACPDGSTCKTIANGSYCLQNCDPTSQADACRLGYGCCSGPGPSGMTGWCAPQQSYLCLAQ